MSNAHTIVARRRLRTQQRRSRAGRVLAFLAIGIVGLAALGLVAGALATYGTFQYYSRGYVPIDEMLVERQSGITRVYDRTGEVELGVLSNPQAPLLHPIGLDDVAPVLINATISTEDNSFWDHSGLNVRGVARAAWENYLGGGIGTGTGGSSITQQLVKNVYICGNFNQEDDPCVAERTVDRKLKEMAYAIKLEQDYSKEQILTWYLNQISYGDRYVGVQAASEGYFRKDATDLTLAEAAMLAGIPAAPTTYHPRLNCERDDADVCIQDSLGRVTVAGALRDRQLYVLNLMAQNGYITQAQADTAAEQPLRVYAVESAGTTSADAFVDNQIEPRLVRMCEAGELPKPEDVDCAIAVGSAGWTVTTTLDWDKTQAAQQLMQEAILAGLEDGCDCHNAAIATIDPDTGQIVVYAPNVDSSNTSDPRVAGAIDQLVEINQPGSSFKPAVYLAWFDVLDRTPMSVLWDTSPLPLDEEDGIFDDDIEIVNPRPGGGGEGLITARAGLGGSQNVPAFRAAQEAGTENVIDFGKRLGITTLEQSFDPTFVSHESIYYGPTIATGGANIRAIDMAVMNATIANMGVMVGLPHHATYIEDMSVLRSTLTDEGESYELAQQQKLQFQRGHLRLPGTRALDPVAVLEVRDANGELLYTAPEPERQQVVDPGSVWLLHSVMSDCTARFIVWSCGSSNEDLGLDVFLDGERVPMGIKTGTQQGPLSAADTLEVWMNGYTRHAGTAVWVGNSTNELVLDGPAHGYASAHVVLWLFKDWMAAYHGMLLDEGAIDAIADFDAIQPDNVELASFRTPTTERWHGGGCYQQLESWQRTDIEYESQCEGSYVILPDYKRDEAIDLARRYGIATEATPPRAPAPPADDDDDDDQEETPVPTPDGDEEGSDPGDGGDPGEDGGDGNEGGGDGNEGGGDGNEGGGDTNGGGGGREPGSRPGGGQGTSGPPDPAEDQSEDSG